MSEFIKFYSFNLVDQAATTIAASSEDAFFPTTNLKNHLSTKVYRSVAAITSSTVVFDFKTIEPVNSILIKGNNLDGFGFNSPATIEANPTNEWSSPAFSTTITYDANFNLAIKTLASSESYRFWRLSLTGGQYVELSNIFIGEYIQLTNNNITFGWGFRTDDRATSSSNRYGQRYLDRVNSQIHMNASFKTLNVTELETLLAMFDYVGESRPLWVIINEAASIINDEERFAGMFFLRSSPSITNLNYRLYDLSFQLREAV